MKNLKALIIDWISDHIILLFMMVLIFIAVKYFHTQEIDAYSGLIKQAEVIKFKLALLTEK